LNKKIRRDKTFLSSGFLCFWEFHFEAGGVLGLALANGKDVFLLLSNWDDRGMGEASAGKASRARHRSEVQASEVVYRLGKTSEFRDHQLVRIKIYMKTGMLLGHFDFWDGKKETVTEITFFHDVGK
jgi:hypothetical protein